MFFFRGGKDSGKVESCKRYTTQIQKMTVLLPLAFAVPCLVHGTGPKSEAVYQGEYIGPRALLTRARARVVPLGFFNRTIRDDDTL